MDVLFACVGEHKMCDWYGRNMPTSKRCPLCHSPLIRVIRGDSETEEEAIERKIKHSLENDALKKDFVHNN